MYWIYESEPLSYEYGNIVQKYPDEKLVIKQVDTVLQDIVCLVRWYTSKCRTE
jgi:hypothetical protein